VPFTKTDIVLWFILFVYTGVEILRSFTREMVLFGDQSDFLAPILAAEHRHRDLHGQSK